MQKQGYNVKCLITIDSKNKDSFMFHTPTIELAKLQAKTIGAPLIIVKTKGVKEKELIDLQKAIIKAKKKYKIEGIVSGAIFSNYQRERIEKISENVGIRSFAPLWQSNQINYLKSLVDNKFEVIITKIAAYGLDESWVGRKIDANAIKELALLEQKYKINPAGEGGEYESLVIDAPFFSKKIDLMFDKKMENEFTGEIIIKKAKLVKK
jgi:asparagine synthase (glutamine-hydrolysing)